MREHFAEALAAFLLLALVSLWFGSFPVPVSSPSTYQRIDPNLLVQNAASYEGERISTYAVVLSYIGSSNGTNRYSTQEGFVIVCPESIEPIPDHASVAIRGVCRINSEGLIYIEEVHVENVLSSPIRSIPGIIIIAILLLMLYRPSLRKLAFVPRGS